MPAQINHATGEIIVLSDAGEWEPARRARNEQTGKDLFFDGREWRDVPAPPERPTSAARGLGLGVRDVAEGLMGVPNMMLGAPQAIRNAAMSALGLPTEPTYAERTTAAVDATGLPRPETSTERRISAPVRAVAGTLPTLGAGALMQGAARGAGAMPQLAEMLVGNMGSQLVGAAAAGSAGQEAAEAGYGPAAQMGAALLGGAGGAAGATGLATAGRTLHGVVQPFSEGGRRAITADILLRSSADPEGLAARIGQGADDPSRRLPGSPVTTAQASRDPGLMLLESGMRSQATPNTPTGASPAVALRGVEAQRNASRLGALAGMVDNSDPAARGATVRAGLNEADTAMGARTNQLFKVARDRNQNTYSNQHVLDVSGRVARLFDPERGGEGMPANLQEIVNHVERLGSLSLDQAQNFRERLGTIAGEASAAGNARLARAAGQISQSLDNTINDPRWGRAIDQRRAQGQALGRDEGGAATTGQILRTDQFGMPMLPDADVVQRAIATPQGVRQVLGAFYKALDDARLARRPTEELTQRLRDARTALRGHFIENLTKATQTASDVVDASGNVSRALSPAGFRRFWEQNSAVASELFDRPQLAQLQRLASDFTETSTATRTASAAGSPTAQNLSVANLIARSSNGLIDPGMPLAQMLGGLGGFMRLVYAAPEAATREMLTRAMTDPQFARMLLSRASPTSVARAGHYIQTNMMDRLAIAAGDATERAALRTGVANTTQPELIQQAR